LVYNLSHNFHFHFGMLLSNLTLRRLSLILFPSPEQFISDRPSKYEFLDHEHFKTSSIRQYVYDGLGTVSSSPSFCLKMEAPQISSPLLDYFLHCQVSCRNPLRHQFKPGPQSSHCESFYRYYGKHYLVASFIGSRRCRLYQIHSTCRS
jgi:hypothetical protein